MNRTVLEKCFHDQVLLVWRKVDWMTGTRLKASCSKNFSRIFSIQRRGGCKCLSHTCYCEEEEMLAQGRY